MVPSKFETSILFVPESIQYSFFVTQSSDRPVGVPEKTVLYYDLLKWIFKKIRLLTIYLDNNC